MCISIQQFRDSSTAKFRNQFSIFYKNILVQYVRLIILYIFLRSKIMSPFDLALMNRRIYQSEIRKQLDIFALRSEHFYMTHHTAEVQNLNKYIYYAIDEIINER